MAPSPDSWKAIQLPSGDHAGNQGRGRTGTVVGCHLIRPGLASGEAALAAIERLRRKEETTDKPSPETEAQRDMVRAWEF